MGINKIAFKSKVILFLILALAACNLDPEGPGQSYTVTFESNGGSAISQQSVFEGEKITRPEDPTKHGYSFFAWYKEAAFVIPWDFSVDTVLSDITLYAKWSDLPVYTVTFESNGGTAVSSQSIIQGDPVDEPDDPTKTGYSFDAWYKDPSLATVWDFENDTVDADKELYAGWTANTYTVTLDWQDGPPTTEPVTATYDSAMPYEDTPERTGYTFAGYYTGTNGSGTQYYDGSMNSVHIWDIADAATLFAKWTATVTYHVGTGDTTGTVPVDPTEYLPDAEVTVLDNTGGLAGAVIQDGIRQRFVKWNTQSDGDGFNREPGDIFDITGNTDLYAIYSTGIDVIGKTGPGGGLVFYDAGSSQSWGRYLEAAPAWTEWVDKVWGGYDTEVEYTGTAVGTGEGNTEEIYECYGDEEPYEDKTDYAAKLCYDLEYGGCLDWFLPSKDELDYIFNNLTLQNLGDFPGDYYWSSSEDDDSRPDWYAWTKSFRTGSRNSYIKMFTCRVRAVRAF